MLLELRVKPGAKSDSVSMEADGSLRVCVREPAQDNRANRAVLKLLEKTLGVPVRFQSGLSSKRKRVAVELDAETVRQRVSAQINE